MPASTAENLVYLFRSAARLSLNRSKTSAAVSKKKLSSSSVASAADDAALKKYVSSINSSSPSVSEAANRLVKTFKSPPLTRPAEISHSTLHDIVSEGLRLGCKNGDDESGKQLATEASSLLYDELNLDWDDQSEDEQPLGNVLTFPWMARLSNNNISFRRKEVSRGRKQKWVFKNTQTCRFGRLVKMCGAKLGPDATLDIFGRLGRETGLKEYNALIRICIEKARDATDEEVSLEQIYKAHQIFKSVRETGFKIEEEMYGQFLMYLVDFGMVEEFFFFLDLIKDENPETLSRLSYYEMLLWIRVNNEVKIQELCRAFVEDNFEDKFYFRENILLALCESSRKEELIILLNTFDITKVTSDVLLVNIFKSLGKFLLEPVADKFLLALKSTDISAENISKFIYEYVISIPNLAVDDVIVKFHGLLAKLEVLPTSAQYEKLIRYSCDILKVHEALSLADEAWKSDLTLTLETFHVILDACDRSCEYNMVHQINSMIYHHNLKPNNETFRMMIQLCVKMKDFQGAYGIISDLLTMKLMPTASMFNVIMAGYFREKNTSCAMRVLEQMEDAEVKPDAMTFACLISNSQSEKQITKNYNDMLDSGIQPIKQVFMALVNAYAACGEFDKAEKVIFDKRIPVKNFNEIKGVLVGALASHGQLSGALKLYEEIKEADCHLDPKAIRCLIEHFQSKGELNRLLQLLEELTSSPYWVDACFRVISYCVQHEHLRSTLDLLKQVKDKFSNCQVATEVLFDEVFCFIVEKEGKDMQFGLNLLQAIKSELAVRPSRKSLDFLLSACVNCKDAKTAFAIWEEYKKAGLPYNVLSFVRMYQALLASGERVSAAKMLNKISKDDPHVLCVIQACQKTYLKPSSVEKNQKKKKKALAATLGLLDGLETRPGNKG
ncbi:pentatricopeptide repeat-containing protein At4g04790, mitochondrial-like isoform X1 [Primulina huaijiensis]|uniref:pentatricopeptide repeat-containing protein At4g04790, mitochondrial-like isoform X1 n=1 Tax=Primulina huaijiensis TaxID=1492673 RepID=UPI003CC6EA03